MNRNPALAAFPKAPPSAPAAIELRQEGRVTTCVLPLLHSEWRRGSGRGGTRSAGQPLSPALSPLVPRGAREKPGRKPGLISMAVPSAPSTGGRAFLAHQTAPPTGGRPSRTRQTATPTGGRAYLTHQTAPPTGGRPSRTHQAASPTSGRPSLTRQTASPTEVGRSSIPPNAFITNIKQKQRPPAALGFFPEPLDVCAIE